jgi:creatinine amidohydrolase
LPQKARSAPVVRRRWQELTTEEFAALDRARTVAVLPVAAIEQHGPHLPLSTDAVIAAGVLDRALALLANDVPALALPLFEVGTSPEHLDFPGTLSLAPATLIAALGEIGTSVARAGVRRLVLFNSHGGHPGALAIVAQELRGRSGLAVAVAHVWTLMRPAELFPAQECTVGIHGGAVETAMMLHLAPELVRRDQIAEFRSSAAGLDRKFPTLAAAGRLRVAWQAQDLNPAGVIGDARLATDVAGKTLVDQAARGLATIIEELSRLPIEKVLKRPPS